MHPLVARYLDLDRAVSVLEATSHSTPDDAAFAAAAVANPRARTAVLEGRGKKTPSDKTQQGLIALATETAAMSLERDEVLGPKLKRAREAMQAEGASAEEAQFLVVQAVLEEAFGYLDEPDAFDSAYLAETFDSMVPLAKVTGDGVDAWLETFVKQAPAEKALRMTVAETLLDLAWGEGPQPITPEHVDDALDLIANRVASSELIKATALVAALLEQLAGYGVVGAERLRRLTALAKSVSSEVATDDALEDDDEDDDDDEKA